MNRRSLAALTAAALLTAAVFSTIFSQPAAHKGPNVLLIVWDTVRADRMSVYGYDKPTTPKLAKRAKDGLVFERAISPAIWTPPSHASMFTGFSPPHHGVKATYKWLDHHHVTLAEWLTVHGYDTYAFSANPYISTDTNLGQGFSQIDHTFEGDWKREARKATKAKLIAEDASTDISPRWRPNRGQHASGSIHPYKDGGPVSGEALMAWLGNRLNPSRPWFAYINMMEAHIPRVPSIESRKAVMPDSDIVTSLITDVSQINLLSYTFGKKHYTEDQLRAANGVYDASLRDLDDVTHDLIENLKNAGLLDNTIVVLTSDHGENLGDHHMFGHKFGVYETLSRVPLIIWHDGHVKPGRVAHAVSNLDLFSTILSLVGVDLPDTTPDGTGNLIEASRPMAVFTHMLESTPVSINRIDKLHGIEDKEPWFRTYRSVEIDGWKLVESSENEHELFHMPKDPEEAHDLHADHPERVRDLTKALHDRLAAIPKYDPSLQTELDQEPPIASNTREMLERLGYLEDEEGAASSD